MCVNTHVQEGACICWVLMSDSDGCLGLRPRGWRRRGSAGGEGGRMGAEEPKAAVGKGVAWETWVLENRFYS